jgi:hypothetical protein
MQLNDLIEFLDKPVKPFPTIGFSRRLLFRGPPKQHAGVNSTDAERIVYDVIQFRGWKVPEILLSGNHAEIAKWRKEQALRRTKENRPDLLH